ncbi:uncharacterized sugar kinase slr0537 [Phtheirospermum japonicum]|uniref:Uncharacterized sugar kinase slr0537 n=1 Tax=Phtheirospermum japonicum TaxID=374723 RepID=A0A830CH77_9LAMI|nr:uncharacterized sugar kinase slr0537 [Phtheirospermum japonicum]
MGVEIQRKINGENVITVAAAPLIVGLQPSALVDHVARVDLSLLSRIPGEPGGSFPVATDELNFILNEIHTHNDVSPENASPLKTIAGGSVANTIRGLAGGFGISCGIIGACGDDDQGSLFIDNMGSYKVDLSRLRLKNGPTAQCVCLVDELGNRTMRPCLSSAVKVQANDLATADMRGSKWLVLRYAIFNMEVIQAAIKIAKQEGLYVSLDLASFEMVRKFRLPLLQLLESGSVDLCFANEDEAAVLLTGDDKADPESALEFLGKHCQWAVGLSLEECCKIGSCSGGSVIRSLGGEVSPDNWQWMYKQMQTKGLPVPDHS